MLKSNFVCEFEDFEIISASGSDTNWLFRVGAEVDQTTHTMADIFDGDEWQMGLLWNEAENIRCMEVIDKNENRTVHSHTNTFNVTDYDIENFHMLSFGGAKFAEGTMRYCFHWDAIILDQLQMLTRKIKADPYQFIIPKGRGR